MTYFHDKEKEEDILANNSTGHLEPYIIPLGPVN